MFLSDTQVRELTKRQRPAAQARVLVHLGIPFLRRPDGTLVVLAIHVQPKATTSLNYGCENDQTFIAAPHAPQARGVLLCRQES